MKHTFVVIVMVVVIQGNDYKFDNHTWSIPWSTTHVIVKLVVISLNDYNHDYLHFINQTM